MHKRELTISRLISPAFDRETLFCLTFVWSFVKEKAKTGTYLAVASDEDKHLWTEDIGV